MSTSDRKTVTIKDVGEATTLAAISKRVLGGRVESFEWSKRPNSEETDMVMRFLTAEAANAWVASQYGLFGFGNGPRKVYLHL
jgi:hypothetical protein